MRVFVAGDIHGRIEWWVRVCEGARAAECREILQVGDFGWWPHVEKGARFIEFVHKALEHYDLHARFIDGNHEAFHDLWTHAAGEDGSVRLGARLTYLPRGHRWA